MKPFRFRLESVVTLRNWEEQRARTAYGQALGNEQRVQAQLEEIDARREAGLAACIQKPGTAISGDLRASQWRHLVALERERADAVRKLAASRRIREQKMKLLVDAHRKLHILENLRARQSQAHRADALREEERDIGDIVNARRRCGTTS
jgi:flagellar export protein FliJ